jgi:hypothetical protein
MTDPPALDALRPAQALRFEHRDNPAKQIRVKINLKTGWKDKRDE